MASEHFAGRLRELREQAGLTQRELAEKAGMGLRGYAYLEYGERSPSWDTVLALASALGVDCTAFNVAPAGPAEPRPKGRPKKAAPGEEPKRPRGRPRGKA